MVGQPGEHYRTLVARSIRLRRFGPVVLAKLVLVRSQAAADMHVDRAQVLLRRCNVDAPRQVFEFLLIGAFGPDMHLEIARRSVPQFDLAAFAHDFNPLCRLAPSTSPQASHPALHPTHQDPRREKQNGTNVQNSITVQFSLCLT
jgi:hypothetical protein